MKPMPQGRQEMPWIMELGVSMVVSGLLTVWPATQSMWPLPLLAIHLHALLVEAWRTWVNHRSSEEIIGLPNVRDHRSVTSGAPGAIQNEGNKRE